MAYLLALLAFPVQLIGFVLWDLAGSLAGWKRVQDVFDADEFMSYGDTVRELKEPLALGFNWAAFADDIKRAGSFNPDIGPGRLISVGDETDLQKVMLDQGVKGVYLPAGLVWHHVPEDRCSTAWTLERNRRMGLLVGRKLADAPAPKRFSKAAIEASGTTGCAACHNEPSNPRSSAP